MKMLLMKTSTVNALRADVPATFNSSPARYLLRFSRGVMAAGASHPLVPTAPMVALEVRLRSEVADTSPYPVNNAAIDGDVRRSSLGRYDYAAEEGEKEMATLIKRRRD